MRNHLRTAWGVFCVVFGVAALLWTSYLLFIDNREDLKLRGFLMGYGLGAGAIAIGIARILGPGDGGTGDQLDGGANKSGGRRLRPPRMPSN